MNYLSGILFFAAFAPYALSTINSKTAPSPVSWAIWASVDTLALLAMRHEKAVRGQLTGAVTGAWAITVLALFFGRPSMGSIEWVSVAGATFGVVLWKKTGNAVLAIVCSQVAVFAGAFPTFASAYENPLKEDSLSWFIWWVSCLCALFAIKKWDLANALQPLTFTTIETIMVFLVLIRPYLP